MAVIVTEVVCIFYLRADAIVAPCLGQLGGFVPPGQANTCAQLKEFKQTSDVGVTFLLCSISFGVIVVLVGCIAYLRVREAALADPNSRAAKWMRTTCGRRLARYAKKLEVTSKEESEAVARVEARKAAKAAAKAGSDSGGVGSLVDSGNAGGGGASGAGGGRGRAPRAAFDPTRSDGNAAALGFAKGADEDVLATTVNPMRAAAVTKKAQKPSTVTPPAPPPAAAAGGTQAAAAAAGAGGKEAAAPAVGVGESRAGAASEAAAVETTTAAVEAAAPAVVAAASAGPAGRRVRAPAP